MTMADWEERLNGFLALWNHDVLKDAGSVSAELAKLHAETEFEKYRIVQDRLFRSDFDRFVQLEAFSDSLDGEVRKAEGEGKRGEA